MPNMRRFYLQRDVDVSGVSGTGIVAEGVVFVTSEEPLLRGQWPEGKVVIHWFGEHQSIVIWDSIEAAVAIHGHVGSTQFVWID